MQIDDVNPALATVYPTWNLGLRKEQGFLSEYLSIPHINLGGLDLLIGTLPHYTKSPAPSQVRDFCLNKGDYYEIRPGMQVIIAPK
jgi:hypothetical protein